MALHQTLIRKHPMATAIGRAVDSSNRLRATSGGLVIAMYVARMRQAR